MPTSWTFTLLILLKYWLPTAQHVLIIHVIIQGYLSFGIHGMCAILTPYCISSVRLYKLTQYSSTFLWRMLLMMKCSCWNILDNTGIISVFEALYLRICSKGSEWNITLLIKTCIAIIQALDVRRGKCRRLQVLLYNLSINKEQDKLTRFSSNIV